MLEYFGRQVFYNRYVGEVIVTHPLLFPNAARSDFEYSALKVYFADALYQLAEKFNRFADIYQEQSKSDAEINGAIDYIKSARSQLNFYLDDNDKLLEFLFTLTNFKDSLEKRNKKGNIKENRKTDYEQLDSELNKFIKEIRKIIENKKKKEQTPDPKTDESIQKDLNKVPNKTITPEEKQIGNLLDMFNSLGIELSNELKKIIPLLDEQYIQPISGSKEDYYNILKKLKQDIEELLES